MLRTTISSLPPFAEVLIAIAIGLGIGASFAFVDPVIVLFLILGLILLSPFLNHPEWSIIGMLISYSTILDVNILPLIPIGIGSLNIMDLALVGFIGIAVLRRIAERDFELTLRPMGIGIAVFFFMMMLSTIVGVMQGTTVLGEATTEIRYVAYYLAYFVIFFLIQKESKISFLMYTFVFIGTFVAAAMVAQFIVGPEVEIIYGRIEEFAQDGVEVDQVARIIPAGRYMVYTCFNILPLFIIFEDRKRRKWLYGVAWLLLAIGIILTFNRNFWVGSVIIQMIVLLALDKDRQAQLAKLYSICIVAMILLGSIISLNPETKAAQAINSTVTRFTSLFESDTYNARFDDTANTSSLEWRRIENEVALPVVLRPTPLGLGMGAWYRDYMPVIDEGLEDQGFDRNVLRGYIHNSHFWIIMKAGWLSYVGLMGATAICVWRGFRHWHLVDRKYQPFVIGSSLSLIGLMLSAFVDPLLTDLTWSPVAGVILGLNEAIFYLSERRSEDSLLSDNVVNTPSV